MQATKTARTIITSQSLAAGAGAVTGTWNGTTSLAALLTARITNGATGPTIGCTVTVNVSNDNSTWRKLTAVTAGTSNNEIDDFAFVIPDATMYVQVSIGGNTGQAVTIEALLHELTSVGVNA